MSRRKRKWATQKGETVRSGYEKRVLDDLFNRGIDYEYEPETLSWAETARGARCVKCGSVAVKQSPYTYDVRLKNGVAVELKGKLTPRNRAILVGIKKAHPNFDLRIMFQRDNNIPGLGYRYSKWAEKYGFEYAIGESIPLAWTRRQQ